MELGPAEPITDSIQVEGEQEQNIKCLTGASKLQSNEKNSQHVRREASEVKNQLNHNKFVDREKKLKSDQDKVAELLLKARREAKRRRHWCFHCDQAFNISSKFTEHLHKRHPGQFSFCKHGGWCTKVFRTEEEKKQHVLRDHTSTKNKKCEFCHREYVSVKLALHMREFHNNFIRCRYRYCGTYFRFKEEEQKHRELFHAPEKNKQKCIFCGLHYTSGSLQRHLKLKHGPELPSAFKCTFHCLEYFLTKSDLDGHIASVHKKVIVRKEFKCIYCKKLCTFKKGLHDHIKRCHGDVKIRCKLYGCAYYFHTQSECEDHLELVHKNLEDKKFQCAHCSFRTDLKNNFEIHWARIHETSKIPCPKCGKIFSSSVSLKFHLKRTHTQLKSCEYCNLKVVHLREHQILDKCKKCLQILPCVQTAWLHSIKVC